ncbi:MAG TPA: acyl-phosphate glycerol 3-phosphate acyltransferase [Synergistaceae bacterium]|jgi:glycerol-3-phosphate acyltransferase PlsY|nr:acyl-phosphate glycerol 3-phosphate acyltransferase [Synergistaceae bacterium]
MNVLLWLLLGYFAGSFPSGYLAARLVRGTDIRTTGSGNVGATNVGRLMGKKWAAAVSVADMVKASVGLLLARAFGVTEPWLLALIACAGVLGHVFPLWLGFKGGKGVSSIYGVLFFLFPPTSFLLAPAGGIVWFLVLKLTGYVSVASLVSLWCMPPLAALLSFPAPYVIALAALAALSTILHRDNIRRLKNGTESRFGKPRP